MSRLFRVVGIILAFGLFWAALAQSKWWETVGLGVASILAFFAMWLWAAWWEDTR